MNAHNADFGRLTPDRVRQLQDRVGDSLEITQPYLRHVNDDVIMRVARALGDNNPLYWCPGYAVGAGFADAVAPPAALYGAAWGSWDLRRGQQLPGVIGMHSGDAWTYLQPVLAGDVLNAHKTIVRCDPMPSRGGAVRLLQTDRIDITNQTGELVATQHMSTIRVERSEEKPRAESRVVGVKASYTPKELQRIDTAILAEKARGPVPRCWEDVAVGDPLDPVTKGPLMLSDVLAWTQAVGSAYARSGRHWIECRQEFPETAWVDESGLPQPFERLHWDESTARQSGALTSYDYGAQRAGYATYAATNWCGDQGWLAAMDVQFRGMVFYGDVLRISGVVIDRWQGQINGTSYVKVLLEAATERADNLMPGTLTLALPSRERGPVKFPLHPEDAHPPDQHE